MSYATFHRQCPRILATLLLAISSGPSVVRAQGLLCRDAFVEVYAHHDILRVFGESNAPRVCRENDNGPALVAEVARTTGPASAMARVAVSRRGINAVAQLTAAAHESTAHPGARQFGTLEEHLSFKFNPLAEAFVACTCRAVVELNGGLVLPPPSRVVNGYAEVIVIASFERDSGEAQSYAADDFSRIGLTNSQKLNWSALLPIKAEHGAPSPLLGLATGVGSNPAVYRFRLNIAKLWTRIIKTYDDTGQSGSGLVWLGSSLGFDPIATPPVEPKPDPPEVDWGITLRGFQVINPEGEAIELPPGVLTITSSTGEVYPILGPVLEGFSGADDFEDDTKDRSLWGPAVGTAALEETGAQLNHVAASAAPQSAEWPWGYSEGLGSQDWELQLAVHAADLPAGALGDRTAIGLAVGSGSEEASVLMEVRRTPAGLERAYLAVLGTGSPASRHLVTTPSPDGAVLLSFNGRDRSLHFSHDADGAAGGYQWTRFHTISAGSPGWNPTPASRFRAKVVSHSSGLPVSAGMLHADDFAADSSRVLYPDILHVDATMDELVLAGLAEAGTVLTLEGSPDLDTWTSIAEIVVSELESFRFRPKMASGPFFRLRY